MANAVWYDGQGKLCPYSVTDCKDNCAFWNVINKRCLMEEYYRLQKEEIARIK
jgi:hypothetical protein